MFRCSTILEIHKSKMEKLKASKDKIFSTKNKKKGLVVVYSGKGKGKSTAAFGMVFRAIAHNMPCAVVQFIKGAMATGERTLINRNFNSTTFSSTPSMNLRFYYKNFGIKIFLSF